MEFPVVSSNQTLHSEPVRKDTYRDPAPYFLLRATYELSLCHRCCGGSMVPGWPGGRGRPTHLKVWLVCTYFDVNTNSAPCFLASTVEPSSRKTSISCSNDSRLVVPVWPNHLVGHLAQTINSGTRTAAEVVFRLSTHIYILKRLVLIHSFLHSPCASFCWISPS